MTDIDKKCKEKNIKTPSDLANVAKNRRQYLNPSKTTDARIELFNILSTLDQNDGIMYLEELIKIDQKPWSGFPGEIKLIELIKLAEDKLVEFKKSNFKFPQKQKRTKINLIYWRKDDEILRQFLNNLKSVGLIESRDTDDIIKEHFYVDGQKLNRNKESQPIKWMVSLSLLAYLIESLDGIYIKPDNLWQDTTNTHFSKGGQAPQNMRQIANGYKDNKSGKPKDYQVIDQILENLQADRLQ